MTVAVDYAPRILQVPPGIRGSYVDEVGEVMEMAGRPLDPHQLLAVEALTSYGRGGKWPTLVAGVEGPRQTVGKTGGILLPIALTLSLIFEPDERTWTAHRLDTTAKAFEDVKRMAAGSDELGRRVENISDENGNEHVAFTNGAKLWFKARSVRAGRGLSGNDVFGDELLFFTDAQAGALLPTMATRSAVGNPRFWPASSAAKSESKYLRRLRQRAAAGDPTVTYVGWFARGGWEDPPCDRGRDCLHTYGVTGCALDDRDLWHEANPGLGVRTSVEFLESMRRDLDPLEFGREFLGWQEEDAGTSAIALGSWSSLTDPASRPMPRPVALGVDVAYELRSAAVLAAGFREDGLMHVEVLAHRPGVSWLPEFLGGKQAETSCRIALRSGTTPAAAVKSDLEHLDIDWVGATDYAAACSSLQALVAERGLRHLGDPILTAAFASAVRRDIGDGAWMWSQKASTGDITPIVGLTLAAATLPHVPSYDPLESFG